MARDGGQAAGFVGSDGGSATHAALERALRERVRGEVRFDATSRALYATDASNYRQVPIGVVVPLDEDDVIATVAACREHGAPVLSRGGGTSLAGQCCNVAVVIDMSKHLNRVLQIDPQRRLALVEPGCVLDDLRDAAEQHQLTFGPDPSTHDHNTLGGMVGNNSCGVHALMAGRTADNVHSLEILTYDGERMSVGETSPEELQAIIAGGGRRGEIYAGLRDLRDQCADDIRARFPDIPRRVSGFCLDQLLPERHFHVGRALVGSEGTCVIVLKAWLRLVHSPPVRKLLVLGYPDIYSAGDAVAGIRPYGPIGLEGIDDRLVGYLRELGRACDDLPLLPDGNGWLLVEFGGDDEADANKQADALEQALREGDGPHPHVCRYDGAEAAALWEIRKSALGATAHVPGMSDTWPGWEDAAVPPARVGEYLRAFRKLLESFGYKCSLYGHFGDGCIHVRIDFDLASESGIRKYRRFVSHAADLVVEFGGSLSGEHGDGQSRGELLPKMYGDKLVGAFRDFKRLWDPDWKMNPGKVVDPYPLDQNLRLGTDYHPFQPRTWFAYPEDNGNFAHAALRCVGVGECRRHDSGIMCPSYMATREEMHSTRGRAHLLFEMTRGDVIRDGWRSKGVLEALDLCLACKGCKSQCPVNVDMATYKAEFLAHHYEGRLRPREAYAFGYIHRWSRLARFLPGVANAVTRSSLLAPLARRIANVHPARTLPGFASRDFRRQFRRRSRRENGGSDRQVILWPDTFNAYFQPEVLLAGAQVLESAGYRVTLPQRRVCCGRALYDYGFLDSARKLLAQVLDTLTPALERGVPLVGLEPTCMATFRDELPNLFPGDARAERLCRQSFLLNEFLQKENFSPPQIARKALVHTHCNHVAVFGTSHERAMLDASGLDYRMLDSGCCGMAGAFGYEKPHYDVSIKCGERVLLPAVREADDDTLIIADGYSCREQILQQTGRKARHLAQVWTETDEVS